MTWRRWLDVGCSKNQKSQTLSATLINLAELEINFSYGLPAFDRFPIDLWRKLLARHCGSSPGVLDYTVYSMGYELLRQAIASYLASSRAVQAEDCQQMQEICEPISRVYSSEMEESVQRFLESLGKLKRAYLTGLKEKRTITTFIFSLQSDGRALNS